MPLKNIYCGTPCGKVCFPFDHSGSLTFTWTVGEQTFSFTGSFDGSVCIPYLFAESGRTDIYIQEIEEYDGYDGFFVVGIPEYLSQGAKDLLMEQCVDDLEVLFTGVTVMSATL